MDAPALSRALHRAGIPRARMTPIRGGSTYCLAAGVRIAQDDGFVLVQWLTPSHGALPVPGDVRDAIEHAGYTIESGGGYSLRVREA